MTPPLPPRPPPRPLEPLSTLTTSSRAISTCPRQREGQCSMPLKRGRHSQRSSLAASTPPPGLFATPSGHGMRPSETQISLQSLKEPLKSRPSPHGASAAHKRRSRERERCRCGCVECIALHPAHSALPRTDPRRAGPCAGQRSREHDCSTHWRREFGGPGLPGRDGYPRIGSVCHGAAGACSAAEGPAVRHTANAGAVHSRTGAHGGGRTERAP